MFWFCNTAMQCWRSKSVYVPFSRATTQGICRCWQSLAVAATVNLCVWNCFSVRTGSQPKGTFPELKLCKEDELFQCSKLSLLWSQRQTQIVQKVNYLSPLMSWRLICCRFFHNKNPPLLCYLKTFMKQKNRRCWVVISNNLAWLLYN